MENAVGKVQIAPQAVNGDGSVVLSAAGEVPPVPPVAVVHSSFIMSEVPGASPVGAWRVQVSAPTFEDTAGLTVNRSGSGRLSAQALDDTITEMFMRDNLTGEVSLVGTFRENAALVVENFADQVNQLRGEADLTYFAYTARAQAHDRACLNQGGDVELGYCSFRNKTLAPKLGAQALGAQGLSTRLLSYNVGNVAITCSSYRYKVCYQTTERAISDQLLSQEYQGGKPGIIMLQEMWHGDCRNIATSWWSSWANPRLCDGSSRNVSSAARILGSRYTYACTTVQLVGGDPRNGYECTALDPAQFTFLERNALGGPEGYGLHPLCTTTDKWVDTGFQVTRVQRLATGTPLLLVNTHLSGTTDNECRAAQIQGLALNLRNLGKPPVLIAGDFNTEPYNDSLAGGVAFRQEFVTPEQAGSAVNPVAIMFDSGRMPSARYVWGTPALDHVLSNTMSGYCTVVGYYNGTDHALTDCQLN